MPKMKWLPSVDSAPLANLTDKLRGSFCTNHTGKMQGMVSVSSSALLNPFCMKRHNNGDSVCSHCYAIRMLNMYKGLREKAEKNTILWTETVYSDQYMPVLNCKKFRFEAFGDIFCTNQVLNYFALCRKNPSVSFALWTKNPQVMWAALEKNGFKKPKNLVVIYSSPALNVPSANVRNLYVMPNGKHMIDKIFTVYTKDKIQAGSVKINCGARNCAACGRCYSKRTGVLVNEKLK